MTPGSVGGGRNVTPARRMRFSRSTGHERRLLTDLGHERQSSLESAQTEFSEIQSLEAQRVLRDPKTPLPRE